MKHFLTILLMVISCIRGVTQNIAINSNGSTADPTAMLDISSNNKGILVPRMTTTEREAILYPAQGLLVYDLITRSFWVHDGGWSEIITGSDMGSASGDLGGTYPSPAVVKIQGHAVDATTPADKQVLKWDQSVNTWKGMNDSLALPYVASGSSSNKTFSVTNSFNGFSNTTAIHGQLIDPSGITQETSSAIWGDAYIGTGVLGTSSFHTGVLGKSLQTNGVEGYAAANGKAGIFGYSPASQGVGVRGISEQGHGIEGITNKNNYGGIYGKSTAPYQGVGVRGDCNPQDTMGTGVYGLSYSKAPNKGGVVGWNGSSGGTGVHGISPGGNGVFGHSQSDSYAGVRGFNDNGGKGVYGLAVEAYFFEDSPIGVHGKAYTGEDSGIGVMGTVQGYGDGVLGYAGTSGGNGIVGYDSENGFGRPALFETVSTANSTGTVLVKNRGTGNSLFVDSENNSSTNALLLFEMESTSSDYAIFQNGAGANKIRFDSAGKGYFNGGTQTGGADIAEVFDVENNIETYAPGDVLVISTDFDRTVTKSSEPYSTLVAGVYATKPGVLMTEEQIDADLSDKVPMGVVGVIPTKVCLEGGEIRRGDLLVTSSLHGVAMKGEPEKIQSAQVIGKALENYSSSNVGLIRVLVNVQ